MTRNHLVYQCNLLTLLVPFTTEQKGFTPLTPLMDIFSPRIASALNYVKLKPKTLCVGDGTYLSYVDAYMYAPGQCHVAMILRGKFRVCPRIWALALAQDIITRLCGVKCSAYALCCEEGGVRCVLLPETYMNQAKDVAASLTKTSNQCRSVMDRVS